MHTHTHTHAHILLCVQCGVALGLLLIYISGYLTIQSCSMLLRSAHVSERQTYELLGESLTMVTRHGWSLPSCNDYLLTNSSTYTSSHTTAQYLFGSPGKLLMEISNIGVLFGASIGMFVIIGDVAPATMISLFALDWVSVMTVKIVIFLIVIHYQPP